ncbi:hypothetical protein GWI33_014560 [Rhynchophorus ferrugineus]|uniref:Uncharacterized protein n=1 Tax=Rhynchophorus ferrugineus TaxID=354439 RepID=A0A834I4Y5_RHYFE|nr:hypothetical protein GWI33_014560 [Rhynchophorus ferrugineus]
MPAACGGWLIAVYRAHSRFDLRQIDRSSAPARACDYGPGPLRASASRRGYQLRDRESRNGRDEVTDYQLVSLRRGDRPTEKHSGEFLSNSGHGIETNNRKIYCTKEEDEECLLRGNELAAVKTTLRRLESIRLNVYCSLGIGRYRYRLLILLPGQIFDLSLRFVCEWVSSVFHRHDSSWKQNDRIEGEDIVKTWRLVCV